MDIQTGDICELSDETSSHKNLNDMKIYRERERERERERLEPTFLIVNDKIMGSRVSMTEYSGMSLFQFLVLFHRLVTNLQQLLSADAPIH